MSIGRFLCYLVPLPEDPDAPAGAAEAPSGSFFVARRSARPRRPFPPAGAVVRPDPFVQALRPAAEHREISTMFKFLRSNAKFFYWIIAATFIAFIFVAWGMDVAGGRGGAGRGPTVVGSVNGVDIPAQSYQATVRQLQANMTRTNPDRALNANQVATSREQAWDQLVREVILRQEIERRGLSVTDEEVKRIFQESPPPEILQAFADENGVPDLQAYRAALASGTGLDWIAVERWIRESIPRQKLVQLVTGGAMVTEARPRGS